jgi:hypothetical protein
LHSYAILFNCTGNSGKDSKFLPSAPSLVEILVDKLKTGSMPYKKLQIQASDEPIQFQPRNDGQVCYFKSLTSQTGKTGKDEFLNLHELAYMLPGFVWSIITFPDLSVTCGMEFFFLKKLSVYMLSYDTTFSLGDFYVSVLVAQIDTFLERPCVPIAFLIHERKFEATHSLLFSYMKKYVSARFNPIIVTDGEKAASNAIMTSFPNWNLVSCWNHLLIDVEVWLKKQHVSASEIAVYKSTVRELLMCETLQEFDTKLNTVSSTWTQLFKDYYDNCLCERVKIGYVGHLKSLNSDMESVTNNILETFNNVLKRHQDWTEVTVDAMVMVVYQLQIFYKSQIVRSVQGFGPYNRDKTKLCGM